MLVIASRRPADQLKATLRECEIVNHLEPGSNSLGPTGRAIVVMTRHRVAGAAWHQGAHVSAAVERSIVRNTSGGNSVFAINFAGGGTIALDFERNRFEEALVVAGGAGRPDKVTGAKRNAPLARQPLRERRRALPYGLGDPRRKRGTP